MPRSPIVVILAGPNGSGKTTIKNMMLELSFGYIPKTFINADEIKLELNCTDKEAQNESFIKLDEMIRMKKSFIYETVFSHESKIELLKRLKENGYHIKVIFVLTENPNINIKRVQKRVSQGGHNVPKEKIIARYYRSLAFIERIEKLASKLYVINNTNRPKLILKVKSGEVLKETEEYNKIVNKSICSW